MEYIKEYFNKYIEKLNEIDIGKLDEIIKILFKAWENDNQVFIIGNGGSAATASHMACDLSKGTLDNFYDVGLKRFKVMSLTDNVATMTAIGNDLGYSHVFSQQLRNLIKPGDIVLMITGSGNSLNVINAAETANSLGATTIGLLGFDGGKLKNIIDYYVIFNENHYGRVEDFHLMINHVITEQLSKMMRDSK